MCWKTYNYFDVFCFVTLVCANCFLIWWFTGCTLQLSIIYSSNMLCNGRIKDNTERGSLTEKNDNIEYRKRTKARKWVEKESLGEIKNDEHYIPMQLHSIVFLHFVRLNILCEHFHCCIEQTEPFLYILVFHLTFSS